ncbi:MAG: hypothetical protein AAF709_09445 [Pseudomonadota bacterium]
MTEQALPSDVVVDAGRQDRTDQAQRSDRRTRSRTITNWPARLHIEGQDVQTIVIRDASESGFGVTGELKQMRVDDTALLDIEGIGQFRVRMSWRKTDVGGLEILDEAGTLTRSQTDSLSDYL